MIPDKLLPFRKKAWRPITADGDGLRTASKFSGIPWLSPGEVWPGCPHCGRPLQLFLQLDLGDLPATVRGEYGEGLIQLFYCTSQDPLCEVDCEAFFPFAESVVARLVQPGEGEVSDAGSEGADAQGPEAPFPARHVVGWEEREDYPHPYEAEDAGVVLTDEEWDAQYEGGVPLTGDKLAGWPAWVQGVEYPTCPECGEPMRLVFQIDSEDNLPYTFGDVGTGHLTQCPRHKGVLAFGWACT
jgi:hypothetical protein